MPVILAHGTEAEGLQFPAQAGQLSELLRLCMKKYNIVQVLGE